MIVVTSHLNHVYASPNRNKTLSPVMSSCDTSLWFPLFLKLLQFDPHNQLSSANHIVVKIDLSSACLTYRMCMHIAKKQ